MPTPQTVDAGKGCPLRLKKDGKRNPNQPGNWRGDLKDHLSSQGAFPVSLSPSLDEEGERKMTATSGLLCLQSSKNLDQNGSSLRMLAESLLGTEDWFSRQCALTWKRKVIASKRSLYQLAPSVRHTAEIVSGSLRTTLPTPATRDYKGANSPEHLAKARGHHDQLPNAIAMSMLPTPRVSESEGSPVKNAEMRNGKWSRKNKSGVRYGVKVKDVLARLLPTPTQGGFDDTNERALKKGQLHAVVSDGARTGLKLQPNFVLWMMGYPLDWLELTRATEADIELSQTAKKKLSSQKRSGGSKPSKPVATPLSHKSR